VGGQQRNVDTRLLRVLLGAAAAAAGEAGITTGSGGLGDWRGIRSGVSLCVTVCMCAEVFVSVGVCVCGGGIQVVDVLGDGSGD